MKVLIFGIAGTDGLTWRIDREGSMRGRESVEECRGVMDEWPLIGRDGELNHLRGLLDRPELNGAVLVGPPGVGKTRLAIECLRDSDSRGLAVTRVTAMRTASAIPFGAFAPLLPAIRPDEPGIVDDRADLLGRMAASLVERAGSKRLCLFVDNAHLLDDVSATLVHQLAARGGGFVLATVRSSDPTPDPVLALWSDGLADRIEVRGLSDPAISDLLAQALGDPVDPATAARLAKRCQGNVMFLRELVSGAVQDGSLSHDRGMWHQVGTFVPSERLVDLVEARMSGLRPEERRMLALVSFGEPLGRAELVSLGDPMAVERLERQGLLTSTVNGSRLEIRLAHPLYGDVVRSRTPALQVSELARSLAEVVEATGARRREDALRVATWRLDGGGADPAMMLSAARTARWRFAFPLAERLAQAAVDAGAGFEAKLLVAQLANVQGRGSLVDDQLAALGAEAATDEQLAMVAITRLDRLAFHLARVEEGLRLAEAAESAIADPSWRDMVRAARAGVLLMVRSGGPRAAAQVVEPLVHRTTGSTKGWACSVAAHSLGRLGRLREALDITAVGYQTHTTRTAPLAWYPWIHLYHRGDVLAHLGQLEEAHRLALEQYTKGIVEESIEAQAFFAWLLSNSVEDTGQVQIAIPKAREASVLFGQLERPFFVRHSMIYLAIAHALAGSPGDASATLASIDDMGLPPGLFIYSGDLLHARAWTATARGDLQAGLEFFDEAVELGRSTGDVIGQAKALHGIARLGQAKRVAADLQSLARTVEGDLVATRAAHVSGLARGDPATLADSSSAFEQMGASLLAAEAAADAAAVWRRRRDRRKSAAARRHAAELASRCPTVSTPALRGVGGSEGLTAAEHRVAQLAVAGRTNRQIAAELVVSVRTVESQLYSTYEKLGISGRAELGERLSPPC